MTAVIFFTAVMVINFIVYYFFTTRSVNRYRYVVIAIVLAFLRNFGFFNMFLCFSLFFLLLLLLLFFRGNDFMFCIFDNIIRRLESFFGWQIPYSTPTRICMPEVEVRLPRKNNSTFLGMTNTT
jgi:hypothetical protein